MMNHDPILSEREEEIWLSCLYIVVLQKFFFAGEITKNESNTFSPTLSLEYQ